MAKVLEIKPPTRPMYVLELSEEEITALNGFLDDLVDVNRKVVIDYTVDKSRVRPTASCLAILKGINSSLEPYNKADERYDYFDWWEEVDTV